MFFSRYRSLNKEYLKKNRRGGEGGGNGKYKKEGRKRKKENENI
jgi:hypothetical protein